MKKIFLYVCLIMLCNKNLLAQINSDTLFKTKLKTSFLNLLVEESQDAQKQKSGSTKDILPNLYQLALKNIFSKNGELSLSTTLFGLADSINRKIESSELYSKFRWTRNISINITGKLDSANKKIETFGGGIKFAIINNRDATKLDKAFNIKMQKYETEINTFKKAAFLKMAENKSDKEIEAIKDKIDKSIDKFLASEKKEDLDTEFKAALIAVTKAVSNSQTPEDIFLNPAHYFKDWRENLSQKSLWTFSYNVYYNSIAKIDTNAFQSDYVKGLGLNKNKPWELNISSSIKFCSKSDSINKISKPFHFETGINKILTKDANDESQMELKIFGSYDKDFATNKKSEIAANATFRYKVFKDFWVPVSIKYDPDNGNVFGFVTFSFNLDKYK